MTFELTPIADPVEVLGFLRAGDTLARCLATGWRLVRADMPVTEGAVSVLQRGACWFVDGNEPFDFKGGRLAPMGDGLPGFNIAQTWRWAEGASNARH